MVAPIIPIGVALGIGAVTYFEWPKIRDEKSKLKAQHAARKAAAAKIAQGERPVETQTLRSQTANGLPFQIVYPVIGDQTIHQQNPENYYPPASAPLPPTQPIRIAGPRGNGASYAPSAVVVKSTVPGQIQFSPTIITPTGASSLRIESPQDVQNALNTLGYGPLAIDGDIGPKTRASIHAFQLAHRIAPTGKSGHQVMAALASVLGGLAASRSAIGISPAVQAATHQSTRALVPITSALDVQKSLNALGAAPLVKLTNVYDTKTTAAIKAFQLLHGLRADGIAGPKTKTALAIAGTPVSSVHNNAFGFDGRPTLAWRAWERRHRDEFQNGHRDIFGFDEARNAEEAHRRHRGDPNDPNYDDSHSVIGRGGILNPLTPLKSIVNPLTPFKALGHLFGHHHNQQQPFDPRHMGVHRREELQHAEMRRHQHEQQHFHGDRERIGLRRPDRFNEFHRYPVDSDLVPETESLEHHIGAFFSPFHPFKGLFHADDDSGQSYAGQVSGSGSTDDPLVVPVTNVAGGKDPNSKAQVANESDANTFDPDQGQSSTTQDAPAEKSLLGKAEDAGLSLLNKLNPWHHDSDEDSGAADDELDSSIAPAPSPVLEGFNPFRHVLPPIFRARHGVPYRERERLAEQKDRFFDRHYPQIPFSHAIPHPLLHRPIGAGPIARVGGRSGREAMPVSGGHVANRLVTSPHGSTSTAAHTSATHTAATHVASGAHQAASGGHASHAAAVHGEFHGRSGGSGGGHSSSHRSSGGHSGGSRSSGSSGGRQGGNSVMKNLESGMSHAINLNNLE